MKQNPNFQKIASRYLFQEISQRVKAFKTQNPQVNVLSLGIGDTTIPIGPHITQALIKAAEELGNSDTYVGYGPEQGIASLREKISSRIYNNIIPADDIFVSDGVKCDLGRLQILFGQNVTIAMQDPTYPVYLDTSLLFRDASIISLPCTPENNFLPDLEMAKEADILFLCLPNNPTGTMCSFDELQNIVSFAKKHDILIIYDAAYSFFVQDGPKTIYEIPGAKEVAIELGSFSKIAGFSGVRLGWATVPKELCYSNGKSIKADWNRISSTFFNGASIISQKGGIAALEDEGFIEVQQQIQCYLQHITIIKETLVQAGIEVYGGNQAPYVWARAPGLSSWQFFELLLNQAHIVTTPGIGFGPAGDGFVRFSGFASRHTINQASKQLLEVLTCTFK